MTHYPFVYTVRQQQDFDALLAEDFQMRAVLRRVERLCRDVVDLVLSFLDPSEVVGQRHCLVGRVRMGRRKPQQSGDLLSIGEILADALL